MRAQGARSCAFHISVCPNRNLCSRRLESSQLAENINIQNYLQVLKKISSHKILASLKRNRGQQERRGQQGRVFIIHFFQSKIIPKYKATNLISSPLIISSTAASSPLFFQTEYPTDVLRIQTTVTLCQ